MASEKFSYQFIQKTPGYLDCFEFVGSSTIFDEPLRPGQHINIDGANYQIESIRDEDLARSWFARAVVSPF